ncbi:hypothetical protein U9M48_005160 [Paspalum notatum var. saurae]|uniref:Transcription repressor n=1 Tax=Paspalum notatum var. saurae TaxID=547442 RepID=A0AAQ3PWX6_PASNO
MSTGGRARSGGGGRQFPVGRRRYVHVPVVDAGCGCRPRRPRLLRLPSFSFLSRPCQELGVSIKQQYQAAAARGELYSCASTSTASFSSSSAATRSTTGYSSAYSSSDYYCYPTTVTAATKQQQAPPSPPLTKQAAAAGKRQQVNGGRKKKKRHEKQASEEDGVGVGVAVEKESSDPRADFRDSMVQMVVEMGLCDWDGLRGMLRRLLALNAPRHHAAILTAFAEVCTQLAGAAAAAAAPPASPQPSPPSYYAQYRR